MVVIPSYHPAYFSNAGPVGPYAKKVFSLVHQIAWFAMYSAMRCDEFWTSWTRSQIRNEILESVEMILDPEHSFGRNFAQHLEKLKSTIHALHEEKKSRAMREECNPPRTIMPVP